MLDDFILKYNLPKFRKNQFNKQYYQNTISSYEEFTDWPKDLRIKLSEEVLFSSINAKKIFGTLESETLKVLFERESDKKLFEGVLLRHEDGRNTVCVSCMIGCPVGCKFCATGKMGFKANLNSNEIVDQILYFQRQLKTIDKKVTNIVFMGMGEPLLNFKEVNNAIKVITDPEKLALSIRRITISTCGVIKGIKDLIEMDYKGRLAISLHAPTQRLREELIPMAKTYKLIDLMDVLDEYVKKTGNRVSYEYILLQGVNDSKDNAEELSNLLAGRLAHVNLIRYNSVKDDHFERSTQDNIKRFCSVLNKNKINYTVRVSLGSEIEGACGQLTTEHGL